MERQQRAIPVVHSSELRSSQLKCTHFGTCLLSEIQQWYLFCLNGLNILFPCPLYCCLLLLPASDYTKSTGNVECWFVLHTSVTWFATCFPTRIVLFRHSLGWKGNLVCSSAPHYFCERNQRNIKISIEQHSLFENYFHLIQTTSHWYKGFWYLNGKAYITRNMCLL